MGYWQDFTNAATPLTLAEVPSSYNLVAVAFGTATLHSRGQKVILSVGGQNGTISVDDATSASNFASSGYSIIRQYGFDGVDIDLENGVNPASMASALEQLESDVAPA